MSLWSRCSRGRSLHRGKPNRRYVQSYALVLPSCLRSTLRTTFAFTRGPAHDPLQFSDAFLMTLFPSPFPPLHTHKIQTRIRRYTNNTFSPFPLLPPPPPPTHQEIHQEVPRLHGQRRRRRRCRNRRTPPDQRGNPGQLRRPDCFPGVCFGHRPRAGPERLWQLLGFRLHRGGAGLVGKRGRVDYRERCGGGKARCGCWVVRVVRSLFFVLFGV